MDKLYDRKILIQKKIMGQLFGIFKYYLFACLIKLRPIILEINTGSHAADICEIAPLTPKELNVKLNI